MKKFIAILLTLVLLMGFFSSCTPTQEPQEPQNPQEGDDGKDNQKDDGKDDEGQLTAELTLWTLPMVPEDFDILLQDTVLADLKETQPGIKVNVELLTWEGGPEKLQIALGTGATPDMYLDGTARTAALPSKGVCVDVSDVIAEYKDRLLPSLLSIGQLDGKNYLFPATAMAGSYLVYNKDLAKELGSYDLLPEDGVSWTMDDLYAFLQKSTDKSRGIYGTALYAGSATNDIMYYSTMLSNGGSLLSEDKTKSNANCAENVEVVEFLKKIVDDGLAAPGAATLKSEDALPLFYNSQITMVYAASIYYNSIKRMVDDGQLEEAFETGLVMFPSPDGKPVAASWGANCFAIFENEGDANKHAAAKEVLRAYADCDNITINTCQQGSYLPAFNDVEVDYGNPDLQALSDQVIEWGATYGDSSFGILEGYWLEIRNSFYPELQGVFSGKKSAQDAMDTFSASIDAILAAQ